MDLNPKTIFFPAPLRINELGIFCSIEERIFFKQSFLLKIILKRFEN